jgi:YidC/Oxa1 family membrane protein insertase
MPQQKNHVVRVLVPLGAAVGGILIAVAVFTNAGNTLKPTSPAAPSNTSPSSGPQASGAELDPSQGEASQTPGDIDPAQGDTDPTSGQPAVAAAPGGQPDKSETPTPAEIHPIEGLHVQIVPEVDSFTTLGTSDPQAGTDERFELAFSTRNTGLTALTLAQYRTSYKPNAPPVKLQREFEFGAWQANPMSFTVQGVATPMGAIMATVNGTPIVLTGWHDRVWKEIAPGSFEATVVDGEGNPVVRFTRTFNLVPNSYDVTVEQRAHNLSDQPLEIVWLQYGQTDLPIESTGYGGEKRRFRFGYLLREDLDPSHTVLSRAFLWTRDKVQKLGRVKGANGPPTTTPIWPNQTAEEGEYSLVWSGMTNRYFGVALHPASTRDPADKRLAVQTIKRHLLYPPKEVEPDKDAADADPATDPKADPAADPAGEPADPSTNPDANPAGGPASATTAPPLPEPVASPVIAVLVESNPVRVNPGQTGSMDMAFYAGPLLKPIMEADASADELERLGISGLILYSFGGPCAFCTFSWLTSGLFTLLSALHNYLLHDWALSIIALVLIVRTTLHPVTKWSQIRVQRFSKQMGNMGPKQKKIQEKYGHDKKRMQEEMAKLWREEGINPAGALGCLPMFLQTPVWIALYAMLFFNIDLRHEAAFFGVFQKISGGHWGFMADMSAADGFIPLPTTFTIPLMGTIHAINILPLVLGFVFYAHQKYMSPPTSATMTPEQQSQQKMMKVMMVVLFPVMMYNAPSGLALYFIVNSSIAIVESRHIRAHIDKHDLHNVPKKPRKEGGFMQRLQQAAEARRLMLEQGDGKAPKRKGPGKQPQAAKPNRFERQYKKKK